MRTPALAASLALLLLLSAPARAQEKEQAAPERPQPSGLALEIRIKDTPTGFQSVPGDSYGGLYRPVAGALRPSDYFMIRVWDAMEGDAVRVKVSAYTDRFHERELPIASYLLREGERAVVGEMTNVGFEPFEVGVVRVKRPEVPTPTATSAIASVGVVSVEPRPSSNFPAFNVALRNLSAKDIVFLEIRTRGEKGRVMHAHWPRGEQGRPLVKPGDIYETRIVGGSGGPKDAEGYTPNSPVAVEVVAAVFSDLTQEGESRIGVAHVAALKGQKAQLARVVALLRESSESKGDARARLEALKAQATALGRDAARPAWEAPAPATEQQDAIKLDDHFEHGLHTVRKELLKDLEGFGRDDKNQAFDAWLAGLAQKYGDWHARL